jgi:hypothetical protein
VDRVSGVLWSRLSSKHLTLPGDERFLDIAIQFQERRNFPHVIGCIDGKHSHYLSSKNWITVLQLQAVFLKCYKVSRILNAD